MICLVDCQITMCYVKLDWDLAIRSEQLQGDF